jgi:hypothetical protein
MGTSNELRPTVEVDPSTMRDLLAKQRRLATGSEQVVPQARPTVQMSKDEILGLREACTDDNASPIEEDNVPPTIETSTDEARPTRRTDIGITPLQWRRPATVVRARPSTFLIVAVLALAGVLSLAAALLVLR